MKEMTVHCISGDFLASIIEEIATGKTSSTYTNWMKGLDHG
jgi:hypothetical protein